MYIKVMAEPRHSSILKIASVRVTPHFDDEIHIQNEKHIHDYLKQAAAAE